MLGFIILVGTVVNNAILVVHQSLNHMRVDGLAPREAIKRRRGQPRPAHLHERLDHRCAGCCRWCSFPARDRSSTGGWAAWWSAA